jgi:hypothetical protein
MQPAVAAVCSLRLIYSSPADSLCSLQANCCEICQHVFLVKLGLLNVFLFLFWCVQLMPAAAAAA